MLGIHKDVLWLILDRPPLNALTVDVLERLTIAMYKSLREAPRLVVFTGMGEQAFCTGVELLDDTAEQRDALAKAARNADEALAKLRARSIATVALVKGHAFGAGCELAALCDTIIAREDARFRLAAANGKVFPSAVSRCLPALVGQEKTVQLMESGETLSAQEAFRLGLVHQVLAKRRFLSDTEKLLVMLAALGARA